MRNLRGLLGLLATIAYPQVIKFLEKKADIAKVQIESLKSGLDFYRLDVGRYPTQEEGLNALVVAPANQQRWNGPYLKSRQMLAQTDMPAMPEANLAAGLTIQPKLERRRKHRLVAIGRGVRQIQAIALGNGLTGDRTVSRRMTHKLLHRRCPADRLVHKGRNERKIGF